jgi:hypothetical protein
VRIANDRFERLQTTIIVRAIPRPSHWRLLRTYG